MRPNEFKGLQVTARAADLPVAQERQAVAREFAMHRGAETGENPRTVTNCKRRESAVAPPRPPDRTLPRFTARLSAKPHGPLNTRET